MSQALAVVLGVIVGAGATVLVEFLRRRWAQSDIVATEERAEQAERRRRQEERELSAADALLEALDGLRVMFSTLGKHGSRPRAPQLHAVVDGMSRRSQSLLDREARSRIDTVIESAGDIGAIERSTGKLPNQIGWLLWHDGREVLGAVIRGEPIPHTPSLEEFDIVLAEERAFYEETLAPRVSAGNDPTREDAAEA